MIRVLFLLIILGVAAWLLTFLPIPQPFLGLIWLVMVLVVVWELLAAAGYVNSYLPKRGDPQP